MNNLVEFRPSRVDLTPSCAGQIELELTRLRAVCQLRELPTAASGGSGTLPQLPPPPLAAMAAANHSAAAAATAAAPSAAGEAVAAAPPGESLVELEKVTDALAASALVPRDSQPSAQPPGSAGPRPAAGSREAAVPADNAGIVFGEQSLTLRGGERVRLRLQLWPRRPGLLTVDGIAWVLAGVAPGQRLFSLRSRAPGSKCVSEQHCTAPHVAWCKQMHYYSRQLLDQSCLSSISEPHAARAGLGAKAIESWGGCSTSTRTMMQCRMSKGSAPQSLSLAVIPAMPRLDAELEGLPPVRREPCPS